MNYENFNENNFLYKLDQKFSKGYIYQVNHHQYDVFTNIFKIVIDKHASIKKKMVRGNEAPMTKELSKAIMNTSKLKNKYTKWPFRENFLAFKKQKNICKNLDKKTKKNYFSKVDSNGVMGNKQFWKTVKHFLTSKGFLHNEDIAFILVIRL